MLLSSSVCNSLLLEKERLISASTHYALLIRVLRSYLHVSGTNFDRYALFFEFESVVAPEISDGYLSIRSSYDTPDFQYIDPTSTERFHTRGLPPVLAVIVMRLRASHHMTQKRK